MHNRNFFLNFPHYCNSNIGRFLSLSIPSTILIQFWSILNSFSIDLFFSFLYISFLTANVDLLKMVPVEILLNFGNYFRTLQLGFWKFLSGIVFLHLHYVRTLGPFFSQAHSIWQKPRAFNPDRKSMGTPTFYCVLFFLACYLYRYLSQSNSDGFYLLLYFIALLWSYKSKWEKKQQEKELKQYHVEILNIWIIMIFCVNLQVFCLLQCKTNCIKKHPNNSNIYFRLRFGLVNLIYTW